MKQTQADTGRWLTVLRAVLYALAAWLLWLCPAKAAEQIGIQMIEPTPLFPKTAANQPLRQRVLLHLDNSGPPLAVIAKITVGTLTSTEALGEVPSGKSTNALPVPDIATPAKLTIELLPKDGDHVLARHV